MTYNGIISGKLASLEQRLAQLRSWELGSLAEFRENWLVRSAVERALQVSVEIMVDIAERILAIEERTPEPTSAGNLRILCELGVVQDATTYEQMIRFRNLVVHRYEYVEPEMLYDIVRNYLGDFESYAAEIRHFIETRDEPQSP